MLERTFQRWQQKPLWLREEQVGHLFRNRPDLEPAEQARLAALPVAVRKALAVQRMLQLVTEPAIARLAGTCEIDADELIVGSLPPFSVGQGKEFVRYLTEAEEYQGMLDFLNELSPMGHIVPDHGRVVNRGLRAIIGECEQLRTEAPEKTAFYDSVIICLQAVIDYARRMADHVRTKCEQLDATDPRRAHLTAIAERLHRVPAEPSRSFADALQAIYVVHCALHWTVEVVPLGRLDQILQPFYAADQAQGLGPEQAQELMDCFWLKLDERVILNYRHAENRYTPADGVLTGFFGSSNFDQGGLLNQWMQQVTIGGVLPNDNPAPDDACNEVTRFCLHSARRLPLNSPTLDLRVHADTPEDILELAARALLSGGAHPVLLNDDRIITGLMNAGQHVPPLRTARNYACDGCYETMFAGETEFSFGFVPANAPLEFTLNRGAGLGAAGPMNLRGDKNSWRSKPAAEIESWEEFLAIMREHTLLSCHRYLNTLLATYGAKEAIAPSPLLSALIDGCIQRGQDLVAGGANYRIFSP
ncbi:pyruvate formate lyase family protein [Hymenobacter cellulosilyticus]|uniref:Pyruvate formate lyase family protein n=1 Tax=Hymenobacter cellulosilyticus TaxID=2932248 RepID=A0A8T9QCJ2_9BACT|nr:pyruvate formate lyase family protein [Hymenobacter cellulosilyticus]UOQ75256.1 pyruvate formate lyase family protein [Hymenobacter cellulosilyticus]